MAPAVTTTNTRSGQNARSLASAQTVSVTMAGDIPPVTISTLRFIAALPAQPSTAMRSTW
jgi:CTP:molybdopterin cytidylyltransferase MocA